MNGFSDPLRLGSWRLCGGYECTNPNTFPKFLFLHKRTYRVCSAPSRRLHKQNSRDLAAQVTHTQACWRCSVVKQGAECCLLGRFQHEQMVLMIPSHDGSRLDAARPVSCRRTPPSVLAWAWKEMSERERAMWPSCRYIRVLLRGYIMDNRIFFFNESVQCTVLIYLRAAIFKWLCFRIAHRLAACDQKSSSQVT